MAYEAMEPEGSMDAEPSEVLEMEGGDDDGEAKTAAKRSAFSDFLSAIGVKPKKIDAAMSAFEEFLEHCE